MSVEVDGRNNTMTKSHIIDHVHGKLRERNSEITKRQSAELVECIFQTIKSEIRSLRDELSQEEGLFAADSRIIAFTSEGNKRVIPGYGAVAAAKASLESIVRQIAVEFAHRGIRANCICPGAVATNLPIHAGEDRKEQTTPLTNDPLPRGPHWTPLPRLAESRELGTVAAFLMSDESSFITGTAMMEDGGLTAI